MNTKKTLLIAAGVCGLAVSGQAQTGPAPVAWYKFDETSGTTAVNSVAGSTDGVITGGVTVNQTGISGGAYLFNDVNGFVDMGDANFLPSITSSGQLTMSAWIKTDVTGAVRNTILFAGDDTKNQTYIDLGYTGTTVGHEGQAYVRDRPNNISSGTGVTGIYTTTAVNGSPAEWDYLTLTINVSTTTVVNLYLNGVFQSTMTLTSPNQVFPTFNNFEVGRLGRSSPVDYYGGLIDDVQVYNSALTGDQITWLYNHPGQALTAVPEPQTVSLAIVAGLGLLVLIRRNHRRARMGIA